MTIVLTIACEIQLHQNRSILWKSGLGSPRIVLLIHQVNPRLAPLVNIKTSLHPKPIVNKLIRMEESPAYREQRYGVS